MKISLHFFVLIFKLDIASNYIKKTSLDNPIAFD